MTKAVAPREVACCRMTDCSCDPRLLALHYAPGRPDPLTGSDLSLLRGVLDDPVGSIRNVPSAPRSPTTERLAAGQIRLTVRSGGPVDQLPTEIADQVIPGGWIEVASSTKI